MFSARHPSRLHRGGEIVVDDLKGSGIAVVDATLLVGQPMFEKLIFDPVERQRARRIETKRLQVAGEHLHRCDAALLDRGDEFAARRKRKLGPAPTTEELGKATLWERVGKYV